MAFEVIGGGSRAYTGEWVFSTMLAERAERFADEIAVEAVGEEYTYGELVDRASRIAAHLQELHVEPGDHVATMLRSTPSYLSVWNGIMWAGAVDVPINTEFKGVFLEHVLNDSKAKVLITQAEWLKRLHQIDLEGLEHVIVVGEGGVELPRGVHRHGFAESLEHDSASMTMRDERDRAYVIYTSGTTGAPKGAIHNHRSATHYIMPFIEGMGLGDDDVCYSMFPLFHTMGRSALATTSLWLGNRLVMREGFSASHFWDDVRDTGATWMGFFGAVLLFLWNQEERPGDADNPIRCAVGASAPKEIFDEWEERFGVTLFEVYGSTEIGVGTGLGNGKRKRGTLGAPCRHVELQIVDEHDNPVPAGTVGEAVWRPRYPDSIFQGYLNRPEETVKSWRNLWYHSGDAGWVDEDGFFTFSDRRKDTIRRRGENISSMFVEEAVRRASAVKECAALAVSRHDAPEEEEVLVAVVQPEDAPIDVERFFEALCESMPRHAVPRYLRFVDELPLTATQRVRKFLLREEGITEDTIDREAMGIFPPRE